MLVPDWIAMERLAIEPSAESASRGQDERACRETSEQADDQGVGFKDVLQCLLPVRGRVARLSQFGDDLHGQYVR